MRKAYERAANDWGSKSFPPKELAMKVAEACEKIADNELAEQGKQHAALYGYEIALLKVEIISLKAEITALNEDIKFYTGELQPDDREHV